VGFVVLLAIAGVIGWLASIISRQDDGRSIAVNVAVAVAGALAFAVLLSGKSLVNGISATVLLAGAAGAVASVAGLAFTRLRLAR